MVYLLAFSLAFCHIHYSQGQECTFMLCIRRGLYFEVSKLEKVLPQAVKLMAIHCQTRFSALICAFTFMT